MLAVIKKQQDMGLDVETRNGLLSVRTVHTYLPQVQLTGSTAVVVVFFTLTDRASTIPSNLRGCQSGTWSAGQKEVRGTSIKHKHKNDNPVRDHVCILLGMVETRSGNVNNTTTLYCFSNWCSYGECVRTTI